MQLEAELLSPATRLLALAVALPALAAAAARAPWREWLGRSARQHVYFGSLALLVVVWSLRAGITPGLTLQFLLVGALTLMHGWSLAVIGAGAVLLADALVHSGMAAWPANLVCFGIVPASATALLHRLVAARLPRNYFVFVFVTAYAGSLVGFGLAALARVSLLWVAGSLPVAHVGAEFFALLPMMGLAEAFMNGLIVAVAVAYAPEFVRSFDDRLYLRR